MLSRMFSEKGQHAYFHCFTDILKDFSRFYRVSSSGTSAGREAPHTSLPTASGPMLSDELSEFTPWQVSRHEIPPEIRLLAARNPQSLDYLSTWNFAGAFLGSR